MQESLAEWLKLWTPQAIVKTVWQLGAPMLILIFLGCALVKHGWPWRPKK